MMRKTYIVFLLALSLVCVSLSQQGKVDRQPAVADQFYPADPNELARTVKELLAKGVAGKTAGTVMALIAPHAGYVFSGEVAASSFNQLDPLKKYENIFVIGSSHVVGFEGASVYARGDFITPLGAVKVNRELGASLIKEHAVFVDRPDAHAGEHSLEVELPFLQVKLKKDFRIVPIVIGTQSASTCRKIADALRPYFTPENLFVISSDFSHYPAYNDAVKTDRLTADAIISNSSAKLIKVLDENERKGIPNLLTSLCGWTSVLTLLYMTEGSKDITYSRIIYRNSGDTEAGDRSRVVGYNSIVASKKGDKAGAGFSLSQKDKKDLLDIAKKTLIRYVNEGKTPDLDPSAYSEILRSNCGAFVTLRKKGELRGCIGRFEPDEPLYKIVQQMAVAACSQDYRFSPVRTSELGDIDIEISVLTPMQKIKSIDEIQMGKHGIYIKKGFRSGTFLPQVADETGWTKEEFLGHCAEDKAGIGWDGWKDADIYIYEALVFSEK